MTSDSRSAKSVKNSAVALLAYAVTLALTFFSRKVFLDRLGTEVLGLNTTAQNLLQFLNLAEMGIGSAVAFSLYKPLYDKDWQSVSEIVSLQGWIYRRIALCVIAGSALLMCFFPWIFAKMPLPLWYAYASFGALLVSALLGYFVNYKQIVLSADQREYRIQYGYKAPMLVKLLCQILAVRFLEGGYVWWLVLEVAFAVIASATLSVIVRRSYPKLRESGSGWRELSRRHPAVLAKTRQLFFHKIGGFALNQSSPIIIYAFASMTVVAMYGNYQLVTLGITTLMTAVFNGMNAGVGSLVAEGNKGKIRDFFDELFAARFFMAGVLCFGTWVLMPPFITWWIGPKYVMGRGVLVLMIAIMYIALTRTTVEAYLAAYGLFRDIWAPVAEAALNVGMSVLLGAFFGLEGILSGVLVSLVVIILCWKPYFLFRSGLRSPLRGYVLMYAKHLVVAVGCAVAASTVACLTTNPGNFTYGIVATILFAVLLAVAEYATESGMRSFMKRMLVLVAFGTRCQ